MNNQIYTRDYYNFKRITEENNFIEQMNLSALLALVTPFIQLVKDELYKILLNPEIPKNSLSFEFKNADKIEIEDELQRLLGSSELFTIIEDINIRKKLFTNAFIRLNEKLFDKNGLNDEKFPIETFLLSWLEDVLAKEICLDDRFNEYEIAFKLIAQTEMLHTFYTSFKKYFPFEWIEKNKTKWVNVPESPENLLEKIRTLDKEYFTSYLSQISGYTNYTPWKYIVETTRYSDYAMFNQKYSFKCTMLFKKNIPLWIKFWDNLKLPILQNIPFLYSINPYEILAIAKELVKQKNDLTTNPKYLANLLLKNLFSSSISVTENLFFYTNDERINGLSEYEKNDLIISEGKSVYAKWEKDRKKIHKKLVDTLANILDFSELTEWAFSYTKKQIPNKEYSTRYNNQVELVISVLAPILKKQSIELQLEVIKSDFNFQKFVFLIKQIEKSKTKEQYAIALLDILCEYIVSDKFYWDESLNETYLKVFKGIGLLLSFSENPTEKALELLRKFKVYYDGWNIDFDNYEKIKKEVFVLNGIILLLEHKKAFSDKNEEGFFFKTLTEKVIQQSRLAHLNKDEDYISSFVLLWLIVNQVSRRFKKYFENEIIDYVDDIVMVIQILTFEEYKIYSSSKKSLKRRVSTELVLQKRLLRQKKQNEELKRIEKMLSFLNF